MNRSGAEVIQKFLVAKGVFAAPGTVTTSWPCYMIAMPDGDLVPNDLAATYDLPGIKEARVQQDGKVLERSSVQVKVRAVSYEDAWQKMNAVCAAVDAAINETVVVDSTYSYKLPSITRSSPISMGPEPGIKRRFLIAVNLNFPASEV